MLNNKLRKKANTYRVKDNGVLQLFKGKGKNPRTLLDIAQVPTSLPNHEEYLNFSIGRTTPIVSRGADLYFIENAKVWFDGANLTLKDKKGMTIDRYGKPFPSNGKGDAEEIRLGGLSLLLGACGAKCYYHWMVDVLPKLGILTKAGIPLESIDHFIVRGVYSEFQRKTLEHLGIPKEKIFSSARTPHLSVENMLHIVYANGMGMRMHPFIPDYIKTQFLQNRGNGKNQESTRIYISRPSGVRRGIENDEQLTEYLKGRGFEIVTMEGLDVLEQACLLNSAETVISPHGGGLTNLIFCQRGTHVVELFGEHIFPYYYALSNLCGLHYYALTQNDEEIFRVLDADEANKFGKNRHETRFKSFRVDVDKLDKILGIIGN